MTTVLSVKVATPQYENITLQVEVLHSEIQSGKSILSETAYCTVEEFISISAHHIYNITIIYLSFCHSHC